MKSGYIALTSAIIVSILILAVILSLNFSAFFGRFNILASEYKENSLALAEACVEEALLKLAQNNSYSGDEEIAIGDNACRIFPIVSGVQKTIQTKAVFQNAVSNLKVVLDPNDFSVISWEEIPTL